MHLRWLVMLPYLLVILTEVAKLVGSTAGLDAEVIATILLPAEYDSVAGVTEVLA